MNKHYFTELSAEEKMTSIRAGKEGLFQGYEKKVRVSKSQLLSNPDTQRLAKVANLSEKQITEIHDLCE